MTSAGPAPGRLGAWLQAIRPKTLWAGVTPVVVGSACAAAESSFRFWPALAALGVALGLQIGTNLSNDVLDFDRGADDERRVGPTRAVQSGLLSRGQVWVGAWIAFGLSMALGALLAAASGWWLLAVGVISVASGVLYTGGLRPLAYVGLGEPFVLVFFGPVAVVGTVWVQALQAPAAAWWAGLAVGALSTAILVVNNLRDRHTDPAAGKRTLAVRFGARFSRLEYALLLLAGYAAVLPMLGSLGPWPLLSWLSLPLAVIVLRSVLRDEGAALNATLASTARLLLVFGLLLSVGVVLGGFKAP